MIFTCSTNFWRKHDPNKAHFHSTFPCMPPSYFIVVYLLLATAAKHRLTSTSPSTSATHGRETSHSWAPPRSLFSEPSVSSSPLWLRVPFPLASPSASHMHPPTVTTAVAARWAGRIHLNFNFLSLRYNFVN
jgi:hypothetical protein